MRPLNLGETLDASIKIVRERWKVLALVMVGIALPLQIVEVVAIASTTTRYQVGSGFTGAGSRTTFDDSGAFAAGQVVILAASFLSYLLGTVACYRAVADTYLGRPTSAGASLRFAAGRLGATLWLTIIVGVGLVLAFVALILPSVWLWVAWGVAYPVMLVEGTGGFAAMRRSFQLVQGHWWSTFARFVVAYILAGVVSAIAALIIDVPLQAAVADTSFAALVFQHAADFVVSLATTPFIAAVTTLVYFDLRVRKEGFDLALLAERMGGAAAAGPAPAYAAPGWGPPRPAAPLPWETPPPASGTGAFAPPASPTPAPAPAPEPPRADAPPSPPPEALPGGWAPPVTPTPPRSDE